MIENDHFWHSNQLVEDSLKTRAMNQKMLFINFVYGDLILIIML